VANAARGLLYGQLTHVLMRTPRRRHGEHRIGPLRTLSDGAYERGRRHGPFDPEDNARRALPA
jgi:hypothetical protein